MLVYHNDGNGHFTEVSHKLGLDKPAKALGIAIADYDRDGRIDLFIANDSMPEFLFHQKPDGTFEEVGLESGVAVNAEGQTYAGMGVDFADYDNDGWPDIVVTDLANQRYALYQNNRDGTFNYASNVERHRKHVAAPFRLEPALPGLRQRRLEGSADCAGPRSGHHRDGLLPSFTTASPCCCRAIPAEICGCFLDLRRHFPSRPG